MATRGKQRTDSKLPLMLLLVFGLLGLQFAQGSSVCGQVGTLSCTSTCTALCVSSCEHVLADHGTCGCTAKICVCMSNTTPQDQPPPCCPDDEGPCAKPCCAGLLFPLPQPPPSCSVHTAPERAWATPLARLDSASYASIFHPPCAEPLAPLFCAGTNNVSAAITVVPHSTTAPQMARMDGYANLRPVLAPMCFDT